MVVDVVEVVSDAHLTLLTAFIVVVVVVVESFSSRLLTLIPAVVVVGVAVSEVYVVMSLSVLVCVWCVVVGCVGCWFFFVKQEAAYGIWCGLVGWEMCL